jgi:site-specific DNA-methyltransferase (adenine-specific)
MSKVKLMLGDNMESLKKLPDNSIDSIVSDPPYGLSFMGKKWDYDVPSIEFWKEVYRVLKPGGHILSFGGTRTYHRMVVNIEDAGFEIRDQIMWLYASGFPKSLNVGKTIEKFKKTGNASWNGTGDSSNGSLGYSKLQKEQGYRPEDYSNRHQNKIEIDNEYEGWGTALKPANEPICVARKPLSEKSVAENVLRWGTGGINIDGSRVGIVGKDDRSAGKRTCNIFDEVKVSGGIDSPEYIPNEKGRFPANIILDEIAGELLDEQTGYLKSGEVKPHHKKNKTANGYQGSCYGKFQNEDTTLKGYGDGVGASRFFYCAKVSKAERNMGLDEFEEKENVMPGINTFDNDGNRLRVDGSIIPPLVSKNNHPTVKPVALMSYLCRLVTPPNGIVLDPFMGSGSTGIAARLEGFRFLGMEMDEDYFKIAEARIENYEKYRKFIK